MEKLPRTLFVKPYLCFNCNMKRGYCIIKNDTKPTTSENNVDDSPSRLLVNRRPGTSNTLTEKQDIKEEIKKNIINKNMKDYNF